VYGTALTLSPSPQKGEGLRTVPHQSTELLYIGILMFIRSSPHPDAPLPERERGIGVRVSPPNCYRNSQVRFGLIRLLAKFSKAPRYINIYSAGFPLIKGDGRVISGGREGDLRGGKGQQVKKLPLPQIHFSPNHPHPHQG
jgi:hypothetical protein